MALQSSGPISLGDIQTEFGGSNPISISEYYGADTGVPGSGTISISDFYGTSNTDVTPDAVDWGNITGNSGNVSQAITGINQTITLQMSGSALSPGQSFTITAVVNGSNAASMNVTDSAASTTFNVSNNDIVSFSVTSATGSYVSVITVANNSDGGAGLDTFNCTNF